MEKARKLPSGRWQARVKDTTSRRFNPTPGMTYATRREAEAAQRAWYEETEGGTVDTSITFAEYAEIVIQARKGEASERTLENEARYIRRWLMPTFGPLRVADIRYTAVKTWLNSLPRTSGRRAAYMAFSTVMEHALQDRIIRVKPRVKGATAFVGEKKPVFTAEQIWSVLDELPEFARDFYVVQWGGGLRISEALGLDWDAVDLNRGTVVIRQQYAKRVLKSELKTKGSAGEVALSRDAVDTLRRLRKARPSIGNAPVFIDPRTGERLKDGRAYDLWRAAREKAGLPDIVPHVLRRNDLNGYRLAVGGDMVKVMARGRHSDHRTALEYQRHNVEADAAIMDAINAARARKSS